jgi:hypothetical protein
MILLIWFRTEAVPEYSRIFLKATKGGLLEKFGYFVDNLFGGTRFFEEKENDPSKIYMEFAQKKLKFGFLARIVSCQICFCFWVVAIICLTSGTSLIFLPAIAIFGLSIYNILTLLMNKNDI